MIGMNPITHAELETLIATNDIVVVDFFAVWCAPCRMMAPDFAKVATSYSGKAHFAKVDVDENPESSVKFSLNSLPTVLVFKNGQQIKRFVGLIKAAVLSEFIESALQ
jgi:thioredoxin 1